MDSCRSLYWRANYFDVLLAAIDASPPLMEENDSSEESASDKEEEDDAGEEGGGISSKRDKDEAEPPAVHRWTPRSMPSEKSPHPRAVQERRVVALTAEWHPWVTVPERIGGAPTMEILPDAVALPLNHCVWKNCNWSGATNSVRWAHIRAVHWSTTLGEAVAYYPDDAFWNFRLETVLGQVAGVTTRKTAPLASPSIGRRCLHALWKALESSDAVQSLICFSCACSYPCVSGIRGSRIAYEKAITGPGNTLFGISQQKILQIFGKAPFLDNFGRRVWDGATTDSHVGPFADELGD